MFVFLQIFTVFVVCSLSLCSKACLTYCLARVFSQVLFWRSLFLEFVLYEQNCPAVLVHCKLWSDSCLEVTFFWFLLTDICIAVYLQHYFVKLFFAAFLKRNICHDFFQNYSLCWGICWCKKEKCKVFVHVLNNILFFRWQLFVLG